ncbi:hypothetical protein HZY83_01645, partial [Gemella sp. GH3]|uniref:FtsX-like permease family protein n=1 Tax=unclassified Gemella TaxID=2624949 RepID=UPI0017F607F8|nr:hypothetical protein [Gemella sp. GH3.1]NYS50347.1 hypothetical protein [Gemella sp. GH3]
TDINVINNLKEKSFDENQDPYKIANNWIEYYYAFDLSDSKNKEDIEKNILDTVQDFNKQNNENSENNRTEMFVMGSNKAEGVAYIFGFIASFLFIGIFISLIFVVSQVMIMYYKQISEGYEDREKFDIMQKVGLDEVDIKKSIRSQILMIFFSPLVVAIIHVTVAYPFIEKLLKLFELPDNGIFITTMIGTFVIFALFYIVVYTITSKIYYNIIKLRN